MTGIDALKHLLPEDVQRDLQAHRQSVLYEAKQAADETGFWGGVGQVAGHAAATAFDVGVTGVARGVGNLLTGEDTSTPGSRSYIPSAYEMVTGKRQSERELYLQAIREKSTTARIGLGVGTAAGALAGFVGGAPGQILKQSRNVLNPAYRAGLEKMVGKSIAGTADDIAIKLAAERITSNALAKTIIRAIPTGVGFGIESFISTASDRQGRPSTTDDRIAAGAAGTVLGTLYGALGQWSDSLAGKMANKLGLRASRTMAKALEGASFTALDQRLWGDALDAINEGDGDKLAATLKTAFEEGIYNAAAFGGLGFMGKHPAALRPQMFDSMKLPDADLKKAGGEAAKVEPTEEGYTAKGEFVRQQTERLTEEQEAAEHEAEFPVGEQPKTPPEPIEGEATSPRAAFEASHKPVIRHLDAISAMGWRNTGASVDGVELGFDGLPHKVRVKLQPGGGVEIELNPEASATIGMGTGKHVVLAGPDAIRALQRLEATSTLNTLESKLRFPEEFEKTGGINDRRIGEDGLYRKYAFGEFWIERSTEAGKTSWERDTSIEQRKPEFGAMPKEVEQKAKVMYEWASANMGLPGVDDHAMQAAKLAVALLDTKGGMRDPGVKELSALLRDPRFTEAAPLFSNPGLANALATEIAHVTAGLKTTQMAMRDLLGRLSEQETKVGPEQRLEAPVGKEEAKLPKVRSRADEGLYQAEQRRAREEETISKEYAGFWADKDNPNRGADVSIKADADLPGMFKVSAKRQQGESSEADLERAGIGPWLRGQGLVRLPTEKAEVEAAGWKEFSPKGESRRYASKKEADRAAKQLAEAMPDKEWRVERADGTEKAYVVEWREKIDVSEEAPPEESKKKGLTPEQAVGERIINDASQRGSVVTLDFSNILPWAKRRARLGGDQAKAAMQWLRHKADRAADWIASLSPTGKVLGKEAQKIGFETQRAAGSALVRLNRILKKNGLIARAFHFKEKVDAIHKREMIFQSMNGVREQIEKIEESKRSAADKKLLVDLKEFESKNQKLIDEVRDLYDEARKEAIKLKLQVRMPSGEWKPLKMTGKAYPQVLNKLGHQVVHDAWHGRETEHTKLIYEKLVRDGKAATIEDAKELVRKYYEDANAVSGDITKDILEEAEGKPLERKQLRGMFRYFELTRLELPHQFVEWDPTVTAEGHFQRAYQQLEAGKVWGPKFENVRITLEKMRRQGVARADIEKIGRSIGQEFGRPGTDTALINNLVKAVHSYQTFARLGLSVVSIAQNLTQGYINAANFGLLNAIRGQIEAGKAYLGFESKVFAGVKNAIEELQSRGSLGATDVTFLENNLISLIGKTGLKGFQVAEKNNQIIAAVAARLSLEQTLNKLLSQREGGPLTKAGMAGILRGLGLHATERQLGRLLGKEASEISKLSNEELVDMLKQTKKNDAKVIDEVMFRAVTDTQFVNSLASRRALWIGSPIFRLMFQFKSFPVDQMKYVYNNVLKEALKGNTMPFVRWAFASIVLRELLRTAVDAITGNKPQTLLGKKLGGEQLDEEDIALGLLKDLVVGGGLLFYDLAYGGIQDWIMPPVASTVENVGKSLADVVEALGTGAPPIETIKKGAQDVFFNEFSALKQYGSIFGTDRPFEDMMDTAAWRGRAADYAAKLKAKEVGRVSTYIGSLLRENSIRPGPQHLFRLDIAQKLAVGDIEGAARNVELILEQAQRAGGDEVENKLKSLRDQMNDLAPLGKVPVKERTAFLARYDKEERERGIQLQDDYIDGYERALSIAKGKLGIEMDDSDIWANRLKKKLAPALAEWEQDRNITKFRESAKELVPWVETHLEQLVPGLISVGMYKSLTKMDDADRRRALENYLAGRMVGTMARGSIEKTVRERREKAKDAAVRRAMARD